MNDEITDLEGLEALVGKAPASRDMKVMDHLDESARRWLEISPLAFGAFETPKGIELTPMGADPGFAGAPDARTLRLPLVAMDAPELAVAGRGFGSLFLIPAIGETLRVNGRVDAVHDDVAEIGIDECYLHCGKALLRSEFWESTGDVAPEKPIDFLAACRLLVVATIDGDGRADVSPKGDPAGAMVHLSDGAAWYADRPGNRRVDSFRNLLTQPRLAALALIPGANRVIKLSGTARIMSDAPESEAFAVRGRAPKIVTKIEQPQLESVMSVSLERVSPWPVSNPPADIDAAEIFVAHTQQSIPRGIQAKLARAALRLPGVMRRGLQYDYDKNLY